MMLSFHPYISTMQYTNQYFPYHYKGIFLFVCGLFVLLIFLPYNCRTYFNLCVYEIGRMAVWPCIFMRFYGSKIMPTLNSEFTS